MAQTVVTGIEVDSEAWAAFIEMRRAKGKRAPFTKEAEKRILLELKKLESIGYPHTEVLWQSVMNGWSGVFPLKHKILPAQQYETWKPDAPLTPEQQVSADKARALALSAVRRI